MLGDRSGQVSEPCAPSITLINGVMNKDVRRREPKGATEEPHHAVGDKRVDLLVENEIGVSKRKVEVWDLDECGFSSSDEDVSCEDR
jgi:hypothetical protein